MTREEISKILIEWAMPARQVAISDILNLHERDLAAQKKELSVSKEMFCGIINNIKNQEEVDHEVGKSLERVCDSWVMFNTKNDMYKALWTLLSHVMGDTETNWISWWIYEDVEKVVYDGEKEYRLDTAEDLYDYLVNEN